MCIYIYIYVYTHQCQPTTTVLIISVACLTEVGTSQVADRGIAGQPELPQQRPEAAHGPVVICRR